MRTRKLGGDLNWGVLSAVAAVGLLGGCGAAQDGAEPRDSVESQQEAIAAGTVVAYQAESLTRSASARWPSWSGR